MTRICIIQGHPTPGGGHFCHALADAYAEGTAAADHHVKTIVVADIILALVGIKPIIGMI